MSTQNPESTHSFQTARGLPQRDAGLSDRYLYRQLYLGVSEFARPALRSIRFANATAPSQP
jgi:hypothetical protein